MPPGSKKVVIGSLFAILFGVISALFCDFYIAGAIGALAIAFIVWLCAIYGAFNGALALVLLVLAVTVKFGIMPGTYALLASLPPVVFISVSLRKKMPVHLVVYYSFAAMFVGCLSFFVIYSLATGSDLAVDFFDFFYREIMIAIKGMPFEGDFVKFLATIEEPFKMSILPQMAFLSALTSIFAVMVTVRAAQKRGIADDFSQLSPIHKWRLPRKTSMVLLVTFVLFSLLGLFGVKSATVVYQCIWQVVIAIYGALFIVNCAYKMTKAYVSEKSKRLYLRLITAGLILVQPLGVFAALPVLFVTMLSDRQRIIDLKDDKEKDGLFGPPDPLKFDKEEPPDDSGWDD